MALRPVVAMVCLFLASTASAQTESKASCDADAAECGRREFDAGIEAYRAKEYVAASDHFKAAYEYRPHPVVLFNWALAESRLEKYVEALQHFDQVLADPETPTDLRGTLTDEKASAERGVATVEVDAGGEAKIFVDAQVFEGKSASVRVNPGSHTVRVEIDGRVAVNREIRLKPGERVQVAVDRTEVVKERPPPPPPPPLPAVSSRRGLAPAWAYAGAGLTVVLGGVTLWSALDTKSSFDDYERDLPTLTQQEVNQRVDDGHAKELRTNVLLGGTAVVGVSTLVLGLFFVDWNDARKPPPVGVRVGPRSVVGTLAF